eukprot:1476628-Rhodomonas_salina.2
MYDACFTLVPGYPGLYERYKRGDDGIMTIGLVADSAIPVTSVSRRIPGSALLKNRRARSPGAAELGK